MTEFLCFSDSTQNNIREKKIFVVLVLLALHSLCCEIMAICTRVAIGEEEKKDSQVASQVASHVI